MPLPIELTRREALAGSLLAAAGLAAASCGRAAEPAGPPFTQTLRVLGSDLELSETLRLRAELDLPFGVRFTRLPGPDLSARAADAPGSYDLLAGSTAAVRPALAARTLVPFERARLPLWPRVTSLYKLGRYDPRDGFCTVGDGDAPFRTLYVDGSRLRPWAAEDASGPVRRQPSRLSGSPSTLALESFAYDADVLAREPGDLSWAELLNRTWSGRVALARDPVAGLQAAVLAVEAAGLLRVGDRARPSGEELDALARVLSELRRAGQFRGFWSSFDESVDLLAEREVVVGQVTAPAALLLRTSGRPVRMAAPVEGYRARAGLFLLSPAAAAEPARLQACYDFATWWHAGPAGAELMRKGYVGAALQTSLQGGWLSVDEWLYWVSGQPAATALPTVFGDDTIPAGAALDGGALRQRACRIAVWESDLGDLADRAADRWADVAGS